MQKRVLRLLAIAVTLVAIVVLARWVRSNGGPDATIARFGLAAPAAIVALLTLLTLIPFPTEPFAVASGAAYGWIIAAAMTWAGWLLGSILQCALARRGAIDANLEKHVQRLPKWLQKLPVGHPLFLICVRWVPMGSHIVNILAGTRQVPALRHAWTAAIGIVPQAILWAAIGAGVRFL